MPPVLHVPTGQAALRATWLPLRALSLVILLLAQLSRGGGRAGPWTVAGSGLSRGLHGRERDAGKMQELKGFVGAVDQALVGRRELPAYERFAFCRHGLPRPTCISAQPLQASPHKQSGGRQERGGHLVVG
jgi:hypothetical protein